MIEELKTNKKANIEKITSVLRVLDQNLDTNSVKRLINLLIFDDIIEEIKSEIGT